MFTLVPVRIGFPQMAVASPALHGGVATSIVLGHYCSTPSSIAALPEVQPPSLILLRSIETPDLHQTLLPNRPHASRVAASAAPALPLPSPSSNVDKRMLAATPPASLALEANPNAHIRALPPETILAPTPAPRVNGRDGVVFVLDVSGSMYEPCDGSTRLALAREALNRRIRALKDGTPFAITLYAGNAHNSGPLVAANNATREAAVRFIMQNVDCGGGTNLPEGLISAQQLQAGSIVLITDGDLNINLRELMTKAHDILGAEGKGPALTVIGIAPRPKTEAMRLLQNLVAQQSGTYVANNDDDTELLTSNRNGDGAAH